MYQWPLFGAAALAAGILDAPRNIYFLAGRDPSLIQRTSDAGYQNILEAVSEIL